MDATTTWMNNIRNTVNEILAIVNTEGVISLGDAEAIATKHGATLPNALSELQQRCHVDYAKGVIQCQS